LFLFVSIETNMDLPLLSRPTIFKPGMDIYVNSVTSGAITSGSVSSGAFNSGMVLLGSGTQTLALAASVGGGNLSYSAVQDKVIISGITGGICASSVNGSTWLSLTTGVSNAIIQYSPELALWVALDSSGTAISTSPTAVDATWTVRTASGTAFSAGRIFWSSYFGRFYTGSSNTVQRIIQSSDGITWSTQASTRDMYNMAFSPTLNRLVCVGNSGPQYSDDGKTWTACVQTNPMGDVAWSSHWKAFVAIPRGSPLNIIWRSVDGVTWTSTATSFANNQRALIWIPELTCFVSAGDSDVQWISPDGYTWRKLMVTVTTLASYGNIWIPQWGQYISSGIGGFIRTSPKIFTL
jgi:hypothetical protein